MRTWKDSMDRLKAVLFENLAVDCTLASGSSTSTIRGFFTTSTNRKMGDSSIASISNTDFITSASYTPKRGDVLTDQNGTIWRVVERDNVRYHDCDNVASLRRVFVQKG